MPNLKLVHINLEPKTISDIDNLMNTAFETDEGIIVYKCHYGSKMAFYRRLLFEGINVVKAEIEKKKKEFESEDSHSHPTKSRQ
jgi:hypothetical protein